jgi:hypothetical protein
MVAKWILGALVGSLGVAYVSDRIISDLEVSVILEKIPARLWVLKLQSLFLKLFLPLENRYRLQDCHRQGVAAGH